MAGLFAQGEVLGDAITVVGLLVLAFVFIANGLVFLRVRAMAKKAAELSEEAGKRASQQGSGAFVAALAAISRLCSCFRISGHAESTDGGVQLQKNRLSTLFSFSQMEQLGDEDSGISTLAGRSTLSVQSISQ